MTSQTRLAEWGHDPTCTSRTCAGCSPQTAGTLWPEPYLDWQPSGTWDGGGVSTHPPLEPPTGEADGSRTRLPTPTASDAKGSRRTTARTDEWISNDGTTLLDALVLLPTPQAWDGRRGPDLARADRDESGGMDLTTTIERLLPTPTSRDHKGRNQRDDDSCLPGALQHLDRRSSEETN